MHSAKSSFESFDTTSNMFIGRESNETFATLQIIPSKRSREQNDYQDKDEDEPLLDSFEVLEAQNDYIFQHAPKKRWLWNCCTKQLIIGGCCLFVLLLLAFILFSLFYFTAAKLPAVPTKSMQADSARLLTFNIFMRPPGIKNNQDDYKEERLDYIIQHLLPEYDIIAMQEAFAFANRRIDTLTVHAFNQGFHYQLASPRHYPWSLAGDGGLLILSRFPIVKSDKIEFPRGVHSDWLSYKGALHALVQINNQSLVHVYTTHTQASYDNAGKLNLDDTKVRLSQFAAVHQFIAETAKDDDHPILLMGDLNVDAALHEGAVVDRSVGNSLAYDMMMNVLKGKGVSLGELNNNTDTQISYSHPWRLDNLVDMAYNKFGYHPVTFGDYKTLSNGSLIPAETTLTSHNQLMTVQSIDRLLWANQSETAVKLTNIEMEPFFVNDTSYPFTQLSDHYGISSIITL
ncbi:Endonuclease/exonuclease/phosphatase [Sporodiniella umbellata]|nr:Endonuclease/exonuclease/phosphatase [Sporodiniella umbellata]